MRGRLTLAAALALAANWLSAQTPQVLDTTTFVVLGEGLAAGLADFSLRAVYQEKAFPALMARQMRTAFPQPLFQAPGIGGVPGFAEQPVMVPAIGQTTGRVQFPPTLFVFNLAVPGHHLSDAIRLRPRPPLVQSADSKLTVTNMILGYPSMILGSKIPLWTQLEYAVALNPTMALVELGYAEALEAAAAGEASRMPWAEDFGADYQRLLASLRANYTVVIATTIPDPADTAFFLTVPAAAELVGRPAQAITAQYSLQSGDRLTPAALAAIGADLRELPAGSVIRAGAVAAISDRVRSLNNVIASAAQRHGALLYDLHGLIARLRTEPVVVGGQTLSSGYLGGLYSLSGAFPGATGHALIANEILTLLNQRYGTSFPLMDLASVAAQDPAVRFRPVSPGGAGMP